MNWVELINLIRNNLKSVYHQTQVTNGHEITLNYSISILLFIGIFNVPHRLKKSADRRDRGESSESEHEN